MTCDVSFGRAPLQVANAATVADSTFLCWARSQDNWLDAVLGRSTTEKLIGPADAAADKTSV